MELDLKFFACLFVTLFLALYFSNVVTDNYMRNRDKADAQKQFLAGMPSNGQMPPYGY